MLVDALTCLCVTTGYCEACSLMAEFDPASKDITYFEQHKWLCRAEGHRGAPPLSGRAHSQPEARNNGLYTADTSRLTGTRTQSAELKPDAKPPHARSMAGSRPPMPPSMAPMGLPHSGYPVGMYPYAHPYFPQGSVSPYPPGPGERQSLSTRILKFEFLWLIA